MPIAEDFAGEFGKGLIVMAWDGDLAAGINRGPERLSRELGTIIEFYAPRVENWMKSNATWTDRTGNARNGLAARYYHSGNEHGIILFHQVPYGIFLEVKFSGRYGIIVPALEEWGPQVMTGAKDLLRRI